jgi:hypothetical protein
MSLPAYRPGNGRMFGRVASIAPLGLYSRDAFYRTAIRFPGDHVDGDRGLSTCTFFPENILQDLPVRFTLNEQERLKHRFP